MGFNSAFKGLIQQAHTYYNSFHHTNKKSFVVLQKREHIVNQTQKAQLTKCYLDDNNKAVLSCYHAQDLTFRRPSFAYSHSFTTMVSKLKIYFFIFLYFQLDTLFFRLRTISAILFPLHVSGLTGPSSGGLNCTCSLCYSPPENGIIYRHYIKILTTVSSFL